MNLPEARALAEQIVIDLQPFCARVEIAGSIRRWRAGVNDIDIVCLPRGGAALQYPAGAKIRKQGEQYVVLDLANGVQLDLWIAHEDTAELFGELPCNWGMLLLSRTGSVDHNIHLAQRAKSMGLRFAPHDGILRDHQVIASRTEEAIFDALGLPFILPENREYP